MTQTQQVTFLDIQSNDLFKKLVQCLCAEKEKIWLKIRIGFVLNAIKSDDNAHIMELVFKLFSPDSNA